MNNSLKKNFQLTLLKYVILHIVVLLWHIDLVAVVANEKYTYYPPYEFIDDDNEMRGFNVDVVNEVKNYSNIKSKIIINERIYLNEMDSLPKNTIGVGIIPNEKYKLYYSFPYAFINLCIVSTSGSNINSLNDVRNKNILITAYQRRNGFTPNCSPRAIAEFTDFDSAVIKLKKEEYDAILCSEALANYSIKNKNIRGLEVSPIMTAPVPLTFATRDSSLIPEINLAISRTYESGNYDRLYRKWFVITPQKTPGWVIRTLIIFSTVLFLSVVLIFLLQRKLRKALKRIGREYKKLNLAIHAGNIKVWGYRVNNGGVYSIAGNLIPHEMPVDEAIRNRIHPEDKEKFKQNIEAVLRGESPKYELMRYREHENDSWHIIKHEYTAIYSNGKIETIIGTHRDITQEYEYRQQLEFQQKKMELAIKEDDLMLWEYDNETQLFTSYNESIKGTRSNLIMTFAEYLEVCHPEDRERLQAACNLMNARKDEHYAFEVRFKLPNDTDWRFGSIIGRPLQYDIDGKVKKYVGLRRDNTKTVLLTQEVEKSVRKINYMMVASKLLSYDYDIIKKIIIIKSGDNDIVSLSSEEYLQRVYWEDRQKVSDFMSKLERREVEDFVEQRRIMVPNSDKFRYVHLTGIPIRNEYGVIISYSGLRRDITELVEIQESLKAAKQQAENADKLKSAFLANMSHEIRTPLNAIVGFSQLLPEAESDDEHEEYMKIINTNTEILLQLIGDILDLSKIEAGMIVLHPSEFDMASLFNEMEKSLRQRCTNPDVLLHSINPYSKCVVNLDSNRVAQVIMNFGTNAIKYTAKGSITLSYHATNDGIKIEVVDTGIGISQEKYSRIFHRFEKLDNFAQGTGLGLSICKALVNTMGGEVGFSSVEGEGSTFWAFIPCTPVFTLK